MPDFAWGCIGDQHRWKTLASSVAQHLKGVERKILDGADYTPPPHEASKHTWIICDSQTFEMVWERDPKGEPNDVVSLQGWCDELRKHRERFRRERKRNPHGVIPPEVAKLDQAAFKLCDLVIQLHKHGCGLGMLTPHNILLSGMDGEDDVRVVLPDLGFTTIPNSVVRPAWLDRLAGKFETYWPNLSAEQVLNRGRSVNTSAWKQIDGTSTGQFLPEGFDPVPDVRALARIFAAALVGRPITSLKELPGKDANEALWKATIEKAMDGRQPSVTEFKTWLENHPLSEYFLGPKPLPPPSAGERRTFRRTLTHVIVALLVVSCIGLAAIAAFSPDSLQSAKQQAVEIVARANAWWSGNPEPGNKREKESDRKILPTTDCSGVISPSPLLVTDPLAKLIEEYRVAGETKNASLLKVLEYSDVNPDRQKWQWKIANDFVAECEEDLKRKIEQLQDPQNLVESLRQLKKHAEALKAVANLESVKSCSKILERAIQCRTRIENLLKLYF